MPESVAKRPLSSGGTAGLSVLFVIAAKLSHAARAEERAYGEKSHRQGEKERRRGYPKGRALLPFAPGGDPSEHGKQGKERAGYFVDQLPDRPPGRAQKASEGSQQSKQEPRTNRPILV